MQGKRLIGLLILMAVVLGVGGYYLYTNGALPVGGGGASYQAVTLKGYVGGEKMGLLHDPDVQRILRARYKITLDAIKAGSIEMVRGNVDDVDFVWPGSSVAAEIYRAQHGAPAKEQVIFNSPIVIYSWDIVADALEREQIVTRIGEGYFITDFTRLVALAETNAAWKDIGLGQLYGPVRVFCTDPTKSNSGNQFAALLANTLNNGQVVDEATLPPLLPRIDAFFDRLGFMQSSSGDLFAQYLKQGVGAFPLVVGYENQIVEFSIENQAYLPLIREKTRILYPQPTVWSSHPLICRTDASKRLAEALLDPEIQSIAWKKHGFRTGLAGAAVDPKVLQVVGVPASIESVMPMPNAVVMDRIITTLEQ